MPPDVGEDSYLGAALQGVQPDSGAPPSDQELTMGSQRPQTAVRGPSSEHDIQALLGAVGVYRPISSSAVVRANSIVLETKQYWEGRVTGVRENEFVAVVRDRSNTQNPDEEVVFGLDEISETDRALLKSGAGFYWFIGRERTPAGQQKNVSFIQFRRTPGLTRSALARAAKTAERLRGVMGPTIE